MSGTITLASNGPNGPGNASSSSLALSADGAKVAFESSASNLVAGDANGTSDVFVKNLATGAVTLASTGSDGQGNGLSSDPSLSADGSKIAFDSRASNLVAGDTNGTRDVFVKDLATGAVTLVSLGPEYSDYSRSSDPVLSADGTKVVFESFARDSPTSGTFDFPLFGDAFVKDLATGAVTRISEGTGGVISSSTSISADGTQASFARNTSRVTSDAFVRDLATGSLVVASVGPDGQGGGALGSSLSADGTKVAFDGGLGGQGGVFVRDLVTGAVTLASAGPDGQGNGFSYDPSLSADGTKVAFDSGASNLVAGDTNGTRDVFVKDLVTGAVTLASAGPNGQGNDSSDAPSLSADGTKVAFNSNASNLAAGDTNGASDVFVKNLSIPIDTTPIANPVIGAGPDQFVFSVSQDAYLGNAQFTISIDGEQQGGTLTATAARGAGQTQPFIVNGTFGDSAHTVRVTFLNDAYGGTPATDRNLYVDSATYNAGTQAGFSGISLLPGSATLLSNGSAEFLRPNAGTTIRVGSGPDRIAFSVRQDAYQGNALFTVSVNGTQLGGIQEARAGGRENLAIFGDFPLDRDLVIGINFLNDAYGGTPDTDRNLFISAATLSNQSFIPTGGDFYSSGSMEFIRPATRSNLTVAMTEDAWQGDAQAEISSNGRVLGQVTVTAPNSGAAQEFSFVDFMGPGPRTVGVNFLNDAYGGTPETDRNLFVKGITLNGVANPSAVADIYSGGLVNFSI